MSGGIFLVISAFYVDMRKLCQSFYLFAFWIISLPLIVISYILTFTRTIWVGALMSVFSLFLLFFKERKKIAPRLGYSLAVSVFVFVAFKLTNVYVLSGFNLKQTVSQRTEFLQYGDTFEEAYQSRETGLETELDLWEKRFPHLGGGSLL